MTGDVQYLSVKVKPNCRTAALRRQEDGVWAAELKSPPVDGKANAELVRLVAAHFGCARSRVSVKSGASGRTKLIKIAAG
jgi:uncharacterized protein